MPPLHSLLLRQLQRQGLDPAHPPAPEQWAHLLDRVSRAYMEADQDRQLLERSLDISSREMQELYQRILALNADLERRVEERTKELEAANHELEAFSYSVSHDLRAPLRAISGFSAILIEESALCTEAEKQDYLARIHKATLRMGEIIDDLLTLSRATGGALHTQPTDLSRMAASVIAELKAECARPVEATVDEGMLVEADPKLLQILLENLLNNAFKYSRKRERARVTVGLQGQNGQQVIYVRDNGIGFDMGHAQRLFTPFGRLHDPKEFEGTGIGLATVRRIVERHGGRIWVEAAPEQGATFYFTLGQTASAARGKAVCPGAGSALE